MDKDRHRASGREGGRGRKNEREGARARSRK